MVVEEDSIKDNKYYSNHGEAYDDLHSKIWIHYTHIYFRREIEGLSIVSHFGWYYDMVRDDGTDLFSSVSSVQRGE